MSNIKTYEITDGNIRIVSDGGLVGSAVYFIHEDGREEKINFVQAVDWHLDLDGAAIANIKVIGAKIDAKGIVKLNPSWWKKLYWKLTRKEGR